MKNKRIQEIKTIQTGNKDTFDYMVNYNLANGFVIKEVKEKNGLFTCILVKNKKTIIERVRSYFKF